MLEFNNISYSISQRKLFENTSLLVPNGYHLGLIGSNGIGKSTLFNLITKELSLDEGDIKLQSNKSIGILQQEIPDTQLSLLDFVLSGNQEQTELLKEVETSTNPDRISEIYMRLEDLNAYDAPWKASLILSGLGFDKSQQEKKLSDFSGGWRMRVGLASALFNEPDLLLLDEPTNHLDFESNIWLENFLINYPRTFILISHDREALNKTVDHIIHIDQLKLNIYTGNYDQYENQYAQKIIGQQSLFEKQQAYKKNVMRFVNRFGSKASKAKQAQSRLKSLEKMDLVDAVISDRAIKFSFPKPENLGSSIITLDHVDVGYEINKPILKDINLSIANDSRIALLGANGNGKSTLIKLISEKLEPMSGKIIKSKKLKIGYFAQHQSEELELDQTAFQVLSKKALDQPELKTRGILGKFGFDKAKSDTKIGKLSGGEKTRLLFCLMSFESPNILLLDEPTNHLDIDSRSALINALNDYEGCVILVSHDTQLIEKVSDQLVLIKDGKVNNFLEDLESYKTLIMDDKKSNRSKNKKEKNQKKNQKKLKKLEINIKRLTKEKLNIENQLVDKENINNYDLLSDLSNKYTEIKKDLEKSEELWLNQQE
ncbi:MAG: ABC-F family ATP-binding cassette domain-containing protein [Dehalococcoidia bacterium]|nr:ABC-F family ATP-binding cassette domain-containing protein [Dehalococcoidia bacterium]